MGAASSQARAYLYIYREGAGPWPAGPVHFLQLPLRKLQGKTLLHSAMSSQS